MGITDYGSGTDPLASPSLSAWAASVAAAFNLKANINSPAFTGTVTGISKAMVGLGSADNTSDANKPISTATQAALTLIANDVAALQTGKADVALIAPATRVKLASDVTLTSTTTMTNITNYKITSAPANAEYDISGTLFMTGDAAADSQIDVTGPSGTTLMLVLRSLAVGTAAVSGGHITTTITATSTASTTIGLIDTATITAVSFDGWIKVGGTAGDIQFRHKQVASSATANTIKAGSILVAVKVA